MNRLTRFILALVMVLGLTLGLTASTDAHYTGVDHWDYYPGTLTHVWLNNCGMYAEDLGNGKASDCHWKAKVCIWNAAHTQHVWAQYADIYYPNGDILFNKGPAYSTITCTPYGGDTHRCNLKPLSGWLLSYS